MSFLYPTGIAPGFTALADYWAGRMSGITGAPTGTSLSNPTGTDGYLRAMADGILGVVGYQSQADAAALGTATQATTTFADVGNGSSTGFSVYTFTASTTKTYLVNVDLSCYMTVAADQVQFQLMKDGVVVFDSDAARFYFNNLVSRMRLSFRCPVAMTAGANVLKLQWKIRDGAGTVSVDTNDFRCFTVLG